MPVILAIAVVAAGAEAQPGAVDRLYVMDCGHNAALDQSRWSPGVNVGKPIELSDNCYLIRHGADWLLWDTGYPDAVAEKPITSPVGTATRTRTLAAQLAEVGVKPADIRFVAVSHTHGDHVGNVDLFPESTLLIQKAELDWAFAPDKRPPFKGSGPSGSSTATSTSSATAALPSSRLPATRPGISPCSCICPRRAGSCSVVTPRTSRDNWDYRRVASMNTSAEQTQASFKRIADLLVEKKAQLWINHDKPQSLSQKRSPAFYD